MFTGLVQSTGNVRRYGNRLKVDGCNAFSPLALGDSIAVDGVCLTVADFFSGGFIADISEETLCRTTLGIKSERGDIVNLEPALRFSDRLGGHMVSGHVDCLGEVLAVAALDHSWRLEIVWSNKKFGRYICDKASITINGVSLTVAGCSEHGDKFWVAVIPHTWQATALQYLECGSLVNLEADIIAKYTESLLAKNKFKLSDKEGLIRDSNDLSKEWLLQHGWG